MQEQAAYRTTPITLLFFISMLGVHKTPYGTTREVKALSHCIHTDKYF